MHTRTYTRTLMAANQTEALLQTYALQVQVKRRKIDEDKWQSFKENIIDGANQEVAKGEEVCVGACVCEGGVCDRDKWG